MESQYRTHPRYVNYEASPEGIIRHRRLRNPLGNVDKGGYLSVCVYNNGEMKNYLAHRFIAEIFIGEIPSGYVIDHIDRNKTNNHVDNLRIVTQRENGFNRNPNQYKSRSPKKPVTAYYNDEIIDFPSLYSAAKHFSINVGSVIRSADGKVNSCYSDKLDCKVSFKYI